MEQTIRDFQESVWSYYAAHGRHDLPWRQPSCTLDLRKIPIISGLPLAPNTTFSAVDVASATFSSDKSSIESPLDTPDSDEVLRKSSTGEFDPYAIMVSEIMLQQTQVGRVIPKYEQFLAQFPDVTSLAAADLGMVLRAWQGLGYNRRAKYIWQAAQMVARDYAGIFPRDVPTLTKLPGIGKNTAGAICAYAYDKPAVFIETNIRTVIIHHFFLDRSDVTDSEIFSFVRETLPEDESTRSWYWALMDYGTYLKQTEGNLNKLSKSYTKQTPFHGSKRHIRGKILHMLSDGVMTESALRRVIDDTRLAEVLTDLMNEGLITKHQNHYSL